MSADNPSRDELQQQLLELVYGLLDAGESAALEERIKTDPKVAVAYAEAQRFADVLAASARLAAPLVEFTPPKRAPWRHRVEIKAARNGEADLTGQRTTRRTRVARRPRTLVPRPSPLAPATVEQRISRAMRRTAAIAAGLLAIVTLGGYLITSWPLIGLDAKHVRLTVSGPHRLEPGTDNLFTINTSSATGRPVAAPVGYSLRAANGKAIVAKTDETTDSNGRLTLKVRPQWTDGREDREATLEIAAAGQTDAAPLTAAVRIDPAGLLTQLSLDKPLYQPGEIVRYRSLTLTRFGLNSPTEAVVYFEIHDPSGAVVPNSATTLRTDRGVAGGEFPIPASLAGGEYTLVARSPAKLFADEKRNFFIRHYRLPRLKKDLEFARDSYVPGDHVVADLSVERTEGSAAVGAKLHAIATVDGQVVAQTEEVANAAGAARVEFNLPAKIDKGDAQLAVVIDDGGNKETIAKTIRINLDRIEVSLYPEGGDLVIGLENRVYFTARTPLGKPAHIKGLLLDGARREVARLETAYKGMGSFKFTPQAGEAYAVKAGTLDVKLTPDRLKANPMQKISLSTGVGVFGAKAPLAVDLQSTAGNLPLVVAAYCRGMLVGQQAITAREGTNHVEIPLPAAVGGVVRVTVFEQATENRGKEPRAIAERLVYRRPERMLNVRVADHKPRFSPGDPVELSLAVTNERGEPTAAALGVSVAADSLFKLLDDELPSMPTHFYLMNEIDKPADLEKADFYLSDDAKAPAALDLLLGTQGWRRFAEKSAGEYVATPEGKERVARLAALGELGGPPLVLDNAEQVQRSYQSDLDRHTIARDQQLSSLGRYLLLGSAPIALLFIFIAAWGAIGRLQFWLPTLGTAGACFVLAWIWSGISLNSAGQPDQNRIVKTDQSDGAKAIFNSASSGDRSHAPLGTITALGNRSTAAALSWYESPQNARTALPMFYQTPTNSWGYSSSNGIYFQPRDFLALPEPSFTPPENATLNSTSGGNGNPQFASWARSGSGTLALSGAQTYGVGTFTLNGGTLSLRNTTVDGTVVTGTNKVDQNVNLSGAYSVWNGGLGNGWAVYKGVGDEGAGATGGQSRYKVGHGTSAVSDPTLANNKLIYIVTPTEDQIVSADRRYVRLEDSAQNQQVPADPFVLDMTYNPAYLPKNDEPPIVYPSAEQWRLLTKDRTKYRPIAAPTVNSSVIQQSVGGVAIDSDAVAPDLSGNANPSLGTTWRGPMPPVEDPVSRGAGINSFRAAYDPIPYSAAFQVREYAHHHESSASVVRADFAETLYWNPLLITGSDGKATIKFDLSDAVAKFRVLVDAHAHLAAAGEGRIGSGSGEVVAQLPVSVEPKLPLEVNAGDRIDLPVAVVNDTDVELPVMLAIDVPSAGESHEIISPTVPKLLETDGARGLSPFVESAEQKGTVPFASPLHLKIPANGRTRAYFPLNVTGNSGTAQIEIRGQAETGKLADAKRQTLTVVPAGYPVAASYGGNLSGDVALTVRIPKDYVPGSLAVRLAAYPSAISQIEDGFESILREPTGCFEQASTENYPNVLILEYLQEQKLANPELTRRCKALLQTGYGRLTSYESKSGGFEWFGGDPGHETLTAYGLMEFHEMARVFPVDPALLERTTKWLLSRRDGKGGFERGSSGHQFGFGSDELNDAYITWALSEAGVNGIETEIKHAISIGKKSEDPYIIALAAITALNARDDAAGHELLDWLVKLQAADGHLEGRESFANSGGLSLEMETTALAARAWLKVPAYWPQAQKATDWIAAHRQSYGGFGSTQATILALKALVEHARLHHKTVTGGELIIKRDGQPIGRQTFAAGQAGVIRVDDLAAKLEPGENHLTISLTGENRMPYALDVSYRSYTGASDPACAVRLSTKLAAATVKAGETVSLEAELSNATEKAQPMTVAILGLPAGLEPRAKQLDDLKKSGAIDYYETRPREIICYWRSLSASQKIPLRLDLVAEVPGQYTAPASRAYLYYTAERKQWTDPLRVTITKE